MYHIDFPTEFSYKGKWISGTVLWIKPQNVTVSVYIIYIPVVHVVVYVIDNIGVHVKQ